MDQEAVETAVVAITYGLFVALLSNLSGTVFMQIDLPLAVFFGVVLKTFWLWIGLSLGLTTYLLRHHD